MISGTNGNHHAQSTLFMVNKDKWDTKEGRGKSMKGMYCIVGYVVCIIYDCMYSGIAKGTSWAKAMLNSEKIKPVALAIVIS